MSWNKNRKGEVDVQGWLHRCLRLIWGAWQGLGWRLTYGLRRSLLRWKGRRQTRKQVICWFANRPPYKVVKERPKKGADHSRLVGSRFHKQKKVSKGT